MLATLPKKDGDFRIVVEMCQRSDDGIREEPSVALAVLTKEKDNVPINVVITAKIGFRISEQSTNFSGAVVHLTGDAISPSPVDASDMFASPEDIPDIMRKIVGDAMVEEEGGDADDHTNDAVTDGQGKAESSEDDDTTADADVNDSGSTKGKKKEPKVATGKKGDIEKEGKPKNEAGKPVVGKRSARDKREAQGPPNKKVGKSISVKTHPSGLRYQDILVGAGKPVTSGRNVAIYYTLRLDSGKIVDKTNRKHPFKFRLGIGEVIKGMDIGITGMREGGERHIVVPSDLGYGDHDTPGVPANSTLYFDVTVVKAF